MVWTTEIAEAFGVCQPVLKTGDEVGARMAFREAYNARVIAARAARQPVKWEPSLGADVNQRVTALKQAVHLGRLPAPQATALLPPPAGAPAGDSDAAEQIRKIKAMVAGFQEKADAKREAMAEAKLAADNEFKRRTNQSVEQYKADMRQIDRMEQRWNAQLDDFN